MKYGSVCSGIEAATSAWHHLGWEPAFFSEIEAFPCAVLAHHYATVPNLGDMTKFKEWPDATINVLVGGTPCQSFSVAGLRQGLADPRGNLMLTYLAIAKRYRPDWLVWENVPGVLSSAGGRDFAGLLRGLDELGYGWAYRVLDAQYFGVAQRRRRVFVVGYLGDWRRAAAVLFERESLSGHPAPSREKRKDTAGSTGDGVARCITAGEMKRQDWETCNMVAQPVAHALRGEGFDASEDGTGRGTPIVPVAVAFAQNTRDEVRLMNGDGSVVGALAAEPGMKQTCYVAQPVAFHPTQDPISSEDGVTHAMGTGSKQGCATVAVAIDTYNHTITGDYTGSLTTTGGPPLSGPGVLQAMQVRRLTPVECERLQGFPDGYTAIPWRKKSAEECPDGPRYKALGNSMAVPVMRWIGERIAMVEKMPGPPDE